MPTKVSAAAARVANEWFDAAIGSRLAGGACAASSACKVISRALFVILGIVAIAAYSAPDLAATLLGMARTIFARLQSVYHIATNPWAKRIGLFLVSNAATQLGGYLLLVGVTVCSIFAPGIIIAAINGISISWFITKVSYKLLRMLWRAASGPLDYMAERMCCGLALLTRKETQEAKTLAAQLQSAAEGKIASPAKAKSPARAKTPAKAKSPARATPAKAKSPMPAKAPRPNRLRKTRSAGAAKSQPRKAVPKRKQGRGA